MKRRIPIAAVLGCAMGLGSALAAGVPRLAPGEAEAMAAAGETGPFAERLRAQHERLRAERIHYPRLFREAYRRYPRIPAGTLEALAYAQSRWHQLRPDRTGDDRDPHMPQAWGVMGLYAGDGFADQVGEAASLLGTTPRAVRERPLDNILGAAALLDQAIRMGGGGGEADALAPALERYAGFGTSSRGAIADYARASFAFDVLLALDRGVDDNAIRVPRRAVRWERAFAPAMLVKLRAPMLALDPSRGTIEAPGVQVDPASETLVEAPLAPRAPARAAAAAVDFPGALWVASPNWSSRGGEAVREVAIHTMQGSYAGSISWFQNPDSQASAHYMVRSSDGQVTQMVRESNKAWHVRSHNPHSLGIEHEGYISNPDWYTTAMYDSSSAITRQSCARYAGIVCTRAMRSYTAADLSDADYDILGHQNLTDNDHTDPGQYWNWSRYYELINGGGGGGSTTLLDGFENGVGHFTTAPAYSGSTAGISTASTSARNCTMRYAGSCSLNVKLVDDASSSANWAVRLLSGAGNPGSNVALARSGRVGFYVYSGGSGMSVGVGIDDSDGTERSVSRAIPANSWTWVEWNLSDAAQWNAWAGASNGAITASTVQLDAIWFYRAQTSYDVQLYVDNVQARN